jgi:tRNA A37 threonylcarbamoyladenosine synthetase subunit TsaC/SUA5/YrdC
MTVTPERAHLVSRPTRGVPGVRGRRRVISDPEDVARAVTALAEGAVVAHAFANFYAISTRPQEYTVRRVNHLKGRPLDQIGSITSTPSLVPGLWDLDRLPDGHDRSALLRLVRALWDLGPFGFRGPAAAHVPPHLTKGAGGVRTAQVIAAGAGCPSEALIAAALRAAGSDFLYVTSANRSHHRTGADDTPAHWKAAGLLAEFGDQHDFLLLEHDDEDAARRRYPHHVPMSTSILGFHTTVRVPGDRRPQLVLERNGSLPVGVVRAVLDAHGFGLVLGPGANTPLQPRDYLTRLCDRDECPSQR